MDDEGRDQFKHFLVAVVVAAVVAAVAAVVVVVGDIQWNKLQMSKQSKFSRVARI